MRYLLIILSLLSFVLGEDTYPFFIDIEKQLEFEEKKIVIAEVKEKEMYIGGGGSTFNWLSILNPYLESYAQQPLYINSDIETKYSYTYKFEISQNNKIISELEFLEIIGLNDRLEQIAKNYQAEIDNYEVEYNLYSQKLSNYEQDLFEYNSNKNKKNNLIRKYRNPMIISMLLCGSLVEPFSKEDASDSIEILYVSSLFYSIYNGIQFFYKSSKINKKVGSEPLKPMEPKYPSIKQTLSNAQLKALSESYNKKIYQEMNLRGVCRIDFIIQNQQPYIIEINTIPGLSEESIIPKQAKEENITLKELFNIWIENTMNK